MATQKFGYGKKEILAILDDLSAQGHNTTRREIMNSIREQETELA
jgi:hypothetical protein